MNNNDNNNQNYNTRSGQYNQIDQFYKYINNSPLSNCYNLIRSLEDPLNPIEFNNNPQFYKAPPCYTTTYPKQLFTHENYDEFQQIPIANNNIQSTYIWTDGSCKPNP
jgi:hypothetical protein